jgi:hypothetical protein
MQALDRKFTKAYSLPVSQASFKYTTVVRHKGTVIAFAMDNHQRIYYSVLDFERGGMKGTLDSEYWDEKPQKLRFPAELAQVGYSAAGVQTMPAIRKNGAPGTANLSDQEKDLFLSTTARFTADVPFQVLSDNKHVYVFRQAIDQNHPNNIKLTETVSLVDRTLLCDRFVLASGKLNPKLETRYQRSRNKDLPADRKDSLGYEDLEKKPFYEPTQELALIRNLIDGRFSLVLLPTSLPDVQRWQIFAFNGATQRMDSFNVDRSTDGLFNTRGTRYYTSPDPQYQKSVFERNSGMCPFTKKPLIEIVNQSGFAESALALNGVDEFVGVPHTYKLDFESAENFSIEVWLKADVAQEGTEKEQSIVEKLGAGQFPFAIRYLADSGKVVALRSDDQNTLTITSSISINDAKFHHLAFVKQEAGLFLYIDGEIVGTATDTLQPATKDGLSLCFGCRGGKQNFFKGQLDEIRLWRSARSQLDLQAELHHRLIGNEPTLIGYWRFDEGTGTQVFDQTDFANHAQLYTSNTSAVRNWVKSEALVGEHPGVRRSSFAINGRRIASGCTALLYYQQEQAETGYNPTEKKPIKRNARVMLAVPTAPQEQNDTTQNAIAVLDFAVSRDGGLVQIPDQLPLITLDREKIGDSDISDILDQISRLEQTEQDFTSSLKAKTIQLEALEQKLAAFPVCDVAFNNNDGIHLFSGNKTAIASAPSSIQTIANSKWRGLPAEWQATGIDAIVSWGVSGLQKCYIFKGNQCLLYDAANYRPVPGYDQPRLIKDVFQLPADWTTGIDSAIRYDGYNAYFFKGNQCLRFNGLVGRQGDEELTRTATAPALIRDTFSGVPSGLKDFDAVYDNGKAIFFFKGNQYVIWQKDPKRRLQDTTDRRPYGSLVNEGLGAFVQFSDAMRSPLQSAKTQLKDEIAEVQYNRQQTQQILAKQRRLLQTAVGEVRLDMPLLHTDPAGLTLSGAVLGFAWSDCPPLLFESINGRVSLYFRGQNGQFFAAYYDVLAQRSNYTLTATTETGSSSLVKLIARSTTPQGSVIEVTDAETPNTCTVRIANQGTGIAETWKQVPRQVQAFADVLNGVAQPVYLGKLLKPLSGTISAIDLDGQARSKLAVGATLLIGQTKVSVQSFDPILTNSTAVLRGTALEFDGQDDYIQLADAATLGLTDRDFTVEAWIRVSDLSNPTGGGDRPVLGTDSPRELNKALHLTIRNGKPRLGFFNTDLPGRRTLNSDTWYHIAWRYTKATQEQAVFVNGELDDSKTGQSPFLGTNTVNIGRWNGDRYFKGFISEVRIWNEARSLDQLRSNMNRRIAAEVKLAGYWRFEAQGNQVIAKDYSQYGRHGIVRGNPQLVTIDTEAIRVQTAPITLDQSIEAGAFVYRLSYDYATNAQTNKSTHSLEAGSLSFRVNSAEAIGKIVTIDGKQIAKEDTSAATNCWFTDSQNSALIFSETAPALSATSEQLPRFAFSDDMTLEAWVNHGAFPVGTASILQYNSGNPQSSYALGLFRDTAVGQNATPEERYGVFVGVGDRWVKTVPVESAQQWRHIAAVFQQSYALKFSSADDVVNCGNDITLDLPEGLTIEAFIRLDHLNTPQAILTKGRIDDGTEQDCSYSLYVERDGRLIFGFEDKDHNNRFRSSEANAIVPGYAYRVAVTRTYTSEVKPMGEKAEVKSWYDISFFISREGTDIQQTQCDRYEGSIGSNKQPLEIGQAVSQVIGSAVPCHLSGEISEVRIWNRALSVAEVCRSLNGDEKGLVSWWRFEENQGTRAADSKSNNHGAIANASWTKSSDAESSRLIVYINGESVLTKPWTQNKPSDGQAPQSSIGNKFQGQLDEIRIWNIARTEEQIQDNLFRRVSGDLEHLLAYYNCDAGQVLEDHSGRQLELALPASNNYFVLSTAPISSETAQVRNALAQVKTPFHTTIETAPAVQEYGDIQADSNGTAIGIMKRCYAYIKNGNWHLITGYKVGDLELEWIGQAQYEPQLIGFIEGAPPVPSENLTIRDANQGEIYDEVSSVELTEADQVMYTYAASKETAFDFSLNFKAGLGLKSETFTGIGVATSLEDTESSAGLKGSLEISDGMLREQQISFGKGRTQISRLKAQGAWENPNQIRYPEMGRRYIPKNVGYALVKSKTADVFALRVKHPQPEKRITIALSVRPNPDIPEDWNIITFPINPQYTKQGSLDGKIGLSPNQSPDRSYFKPIEAYALKTKIEKEQQQLTADYQNYRADKYQANNLDGIGPQSESTRRWLEPAQANLFNTYVWTADGGFFAETQNAMSLKQETTASLFSVSGMVGGYLDLNTTISKVSVKLELEALFGGHMNLVSQKSSTSESAFGVNVELDVERDISIKSQAQAELVGKGTSGLYDADNNPVKCPGKVDGYRFMTFYLQPDIEHFKDFKNKVVDLAWLNQSSDPNAVALRQATISTNGAWRVLHRVTYVSRVLPEIGTAFITEAEQTLRAANIESNWELIKTLDPFVRAKSSNYADLKRAVEQAIDVYLPELAPAKAAIVEYMRLYYLFDV